MIVFDLACENGHQFEGWFGSSDDYSEQLQRGLLSCPQCGSDVVRKAAMAPAVPKKGNQQNERPQHEPVGATDPNEAQMVTRGPLPTEVQQALKKLAEAQAKALTKSKWVGRKFADSARAMHYGERDAEQIHGETSLEEAQSLVDEGIEVAPLPFPIAPPEDMN